MNYAQQEYCLLNIIRMKAIYRYYYLFSITLLIFMITIFKYETNCMEEIQEGKGHFFVWLVRGYSSLSYQIDITKLISDFLIFFFIILIFSKIFKFKIHQYIKLTVGFFAFLLIVAIIIYAFTFDVYFEKIKCDVIFSSISIGI